MAFDHQGALLGRELGLDRRLRANLGFLLLGLVSFFLGRLGVGRDTIFQEWHLPRSPSLPFLTLGSSLQHDSYLTIILLRA
mmetsp:Transcript_32038/g.31339  ORF Transcript_32038/g.31339 Transcript_32038/m.31339 type:complete len:81 (+) Transcript_32038:447-689(+)